MASFTVSTAINCKILGYEFSGTGPFTCADEHLPEIKAILEAGGETVSANKITEQFLIPAVGTPADATDILYVKPYQHVITAAYLVPSAAVVGDSTDYHTWELCNYSAAGAVAGTLCSFASTAGTMTALVRQSLGSVTGGTVSAGQGVVLARSTAASGTAIPNMIAVIEYTL
jgi:hypothetical protein